MSIADSKRFEALGQEFVARFDFGSCCEVEERTGRGFFEVAGPFLQGIDEKERENPQAIMAAAQRLKLTDVRLILMVALRGQHPNIDEADATEIVGDIGLRKAMEVVAWAIARGAANVSADSGDKGGEAAGAANPSPATNRKRAGKLG